MLKNFESTPRETEKNQDMSRREFLKVAGATVFSFALPFIETSRALSKEVKKGDSWLEGIEALRDDVYTNQNESMALYIINENGAGSWQAYEEKEKTGGLFNLDTLNTHAENGTEEIRITHTHPLRGLQFVNQDIMTREDVTAIQEGKHRAPSAPASVADVQFSILTEAEISQHETNVVNIVVDPLGVWELRADLNHPFARDFIERKRIRKKNMDLLKNNDSLNMFLQSSTTFRFQRLTWGGFITFLWSEARTHIDEEARQAITELYEKELAFEQEYSQKIKGLGKHLYAYTSRSITQGKHDPQSLIPEYAKLGITVSFKTFEEIRSEEGQKN